MTLTVQDIKTKVKKRQVWRGVDLSRLNKNTINRICDEIVPVVKETVDQKSNRKWTKQWKPFITLTSEERDRFRPIPRYQKIIDRSFEILQNDHPMYIKHTRSCGPEYVYPISDRTHYDWIHIPFPCRFESNKKYYKTLVHELAHAACAKTRLCYKFEIYDEEEVTVELASLIISSLLGINVWDDSLAYIQNRSYCKGKLIIKNKSQWHLIKRRTERLLMYLLCLNKN